MLRQQSKEYDYSLKFLLVGDSDVGKDEILAGLEESSPQSPYATRGMEQKTTMLLIDGKRVKLQLWNTSGMYQLRRRPEFCLSESSTAFAALSMYGSEIISEIAHNPWRCVLCVGLPLSDGILHIIMGKHAHLQCHICMFA